MRLRRSKGKVASPITEIMRRDSPKYGHKKINCPRKKLIVLNYPKVKGCGKKEPRNRISKKLWDEANWLYYNGWKINWIAKKLNIDWHTIKMAVDDDYKEKRNKMSNDRSKRIWANPIERKKQIARVDKWRKERRKRDKGYDKWVRQKRRIGTQKYDATHRELRRQKAIKNYNDKMGRPESWEKLKKFKEEEKNVKVAEKK